MATEYIKADGVFVNLTFKVISSAKESTSVNLVDATFGDKSLATVTTTVEAATLALNGAVGTQTPPPGGNTTGFTVQIASKEAKNGDVIEVPVSFVNVPSNGISTADATITYDASKLEYVSGTAGSIITNAGTNFAINKESDGKLKVLFLDYTMATEYIKADGVFASLTFKVISSAKESTSVNLVDATFGDRSLATVSTTIKAGTIKLNGATGTPTPAVVTPTPGGNTGGFTVEVASKEAKNGDVIEVPVRFINVPSNGISTADATITYDASKLEYVSGTAGSIITNAGTNFAINKESDGKLKVLFLDYTMATEYIKADGVFASLTFKVISSAKESTSVNLVDATFGDRSLATVSTTIKAGTIKLNGATGTPTPAVVTPTPGGNTGGFTVEVASKEAKNGDVIEVPVRFINVPSNGISTADATITYDASKLEYVSGTAGSIITNAGTNFAINKESDGKLKVLFLDYTMATEYIKADGVFASLTFKVISSAKESTSVNLVDATFGDRSLATVSTTIKAGTIKLNGATGTPTPVVVTPTKTPVITNTPVVTPPPVVNSNLKVEFYNTNTQASSNSIYPKFLLTNTGSSPINLSEVKLRYYYTIDGEKEQTFWCDWSPVGSSNVSGKFVKLSSTATGADYYLEISFSSGAGNLAANTSIEVQGRFAKNDWTNYNQADDYSFNSSASNYTNWTKVTAYINGVKVFGDEPDGIGGSTPTPTVVTPTPVVVTPTPTKDVTTPNPNAMTLKIDSVQGKPGDTVKVPVTLSKVPAKGVSTADFAISYDASKLEYVDGEAGSIITNAGTNFAINKEEDGLLKVLFLDYTMEKEYIKEDGVFANLTFKIKSTAAVGTSASVSVTGEATFGDTSLATITTNLVAGKVEVIDGSAMKLVIGNVNGSTGSKVKVPVTIEGISDNGISTADFAIVYDATKLEYIGAEAGSIITNPGTNFAINKEEDGLLKVLFLDYTMEKEYIKEDGVFMNLEFMVKATSGTTTVAKTGEATFGDRSLKTLNVVIVDGSVTVGEPPVTPTVTPTTTPATPTTTPTTTPENTPTTTGFTVTIDTVNGNPGTSVAVPVKLSGIPAEGISTADFAIAYDATKLEYISTEAGSIVTDPGTNFATNKEEDGLLKVLFLDYTMAKGYISKDGVFMTINFNIKSSAAVNSKADVSITDTPTFGDSKLKTLDPQIINGGVKIVKEPDPNGFKVEVATVDGTLGSNVVVPVSFTNVPAIGISTADMTITYDADKLEYVDAEAGSIVTNPGTNFAINKEEDGILKLLFLDYTMQTQFIDKDGVFVNLTFKVLKETELAEISVVDGTVGDTKLADIDTEYVAGGVRVVKEPVGFTVSGYIKPDFVTTSTTAPIVNAGFTVELVGAGKTAVTDGNGYFEIKDVAAGTYTVKIVKANYLTREIANVSVAADKELSTASAPILLWAGDMEIGGEQDGAINIEDIVEICKSFNTVSTDAKYQVGSDLNRDGAINLEDVVIVAKHFNKVSADY